MSICFFFFVSILEILVKISIIKDMAYLFSFKKFAGFDRVFRSRGDFWNPWDLLETADDLVLHLGEEVAFPEMYVQTYPEVSMKVLVPGFFDQRFLSFVHWMVYEWYSSYKNVMKYFMSMEVEQLLLRESKVKVSRSSPLRSTPPTPLQNGEAQTLLIFPDNWTRVNMLRAESWKIKTESQGFVIPQDNLQLFSTDTQNKKDINWWTIKKGLVQTIVATQSEVFQPFSVLKKIIFVDPQKWYYNNQQDPRYSLPRVVEKMAELYGAEVVEIKNRGTLAFEE